MTSDSLEKMATFGPKLLEGCEFIDDRWEIVYDGGAGYIGAVIERGEAWLKLKPVFHYLSTPNIRPAPDGGTTFNPNHRTAFPIEMLASPFVLTIRYSRRFPLREVDAFDIKFYDTIVAKAADLQKRLRAARSHLTIETEMPKFPPPRPQ